MIDESDRYRNNPFPQYLRACRELDRVYAILMGALIGLGICLIMEMFW